RSARQSVPSSGPDPCAAEGIYSQADLRTANGIHVDHVGEIGDVSIEIVVPVRRGHATSFLVGNPFQTQKAVLEKLVCLGLDPVSDDGFRRSSIWGIVFEPTVVRRIV